MSALIGEIEDGERRGGRGGLCDGDEDIVVVVVL